MKLPVWQTDLSGNEGMINALSFESENTENTIQFFEHADTGNLALHAAFFCLAALSSLLLLISIFRYQDRQAQIRMTYIGILLIFVEILAVVLLAQSGPSPNPQPAFALPVLAIIMAWLAVRYIRKDDELVRSVDRIR
jgi:peptidoglycan/LPS O-acetylase OafA/YrhL